MANIYDGSAGFVGLVANTLWAGQTKVVSFDAEYRDIHIAEPNVN